MILHKQLHAGLHDGCISVKVGHLFFDEEWVLDLLCFQPVNFDTFEMQRRRHDNKKIGVYNRISDNYQSLELKVQK